MLDPATYTPMTDAIETASRDEISALQVHRLKTTLAQAYANVAHYKQAFDKAGVTPDDLNELSDLAKFPPEPLPQGSERRDPATEYTTIAPAQSPVK